jgi:hypothetical protein
MNRSIALALVLAASAGSCRTAPDPGPAPSAFRLSVASGPQASGRRCPGSRATDGAALLQASETAQPDRPGFVAGRRRCPGSR